MATPAHIQAEIVARYAAGEGSTTLARVYGVDKGTVQNIVRKHLGSIRKERGFRLPVNHAAFDVLTPEAMYWVGMLMADGCISQPRQDRHRLNKQLIFHLGAVDGHHVFRFRAFMQAAHKVSDVRQVDKRTGVVSFSTRLAIVSERACSRLIALGVTTAKTFTAVAAEEVASSRDFWRGVADGDGCVFAAQAHHELLGSKPLCEQYVHFLASIGCPNPVLREREGCWCVDTHGEQARRSMGVLYRPGDVCLLRKMYRARHWISGSTKPQALYE